MALIDCPTPTRLDALLQGRLAADKTADLEEHLGSCSRCQHLLDGLVGRLPVTRAMRSGRPEGVDGVELPGGLVERLDDLAAQFTHVSWADLDGLRSGDPSEAVGLAPPVRAGDVGQVGPYRVLKLLGAGGMGLVYLAEDSGLGRLVALKLLRPHLARHPKAREGFLREARVAAALKHDNVVTVYQVSEIASDDGDAVPYLAMELLEGESLSDALRRTGPLPTAAVVRLGQQAAAGLAAAHARGVLHRDIKPGNLWLEAPAGWADLPADRRPPLPGVGRLKILDFGLAQQAGGDDVESIGFGTPAYMSPEHARGEPLSSAADVFSLGVVLYELATGRLPFVREKRGVPSYSPPKDPREHVLGVPPGLAELILGLLALEPRERLPAKEIAALLGGMATLTTAETIEARSNATVPVRPLKSTASRWRAAVAGLLFVVAAAGIGYAIHAANTPAVQPPDTKLAGPPDDEWCRIVGDLPGEQQFAAVMDKLRELNPGFPGQATVRIEDGQLRSFSFLTDHVWDIRPIRACKHLKRLECNGSSRDRGQLSDLSPLRGLQLTELNCWWNRNLKDLSAVRGMPLQSTQFGETPVSDLSPLAGMPLQTLCVNGCPVQTIEVVRTLPKLTFLNCLDCPIPTLEPVTGSGLRHIAFTYREKRGDRDVLRQLPKLERINWEPAAQYLKNHPPTNVN